jgi:hypothetical protein
VLSARCSARAAPELRRVRELRAHADSMQHNPLPFCVFQKCSRLSAHESTWAAIGDIGDIVTSEKSLEPNQKYSARVDGARVFAAGVTISITYT